MTTKILKSLKGRRMRLTRLDACGAPIIGDCASIVTDGFISVNYSQEIEAGEEYTLKNAWGDLAISEKDGDITKWLNVAMELCEINPDVLDLVGGGDPITDGTDTIGAAFGEDGNLEAFAVEVWTKQAGPACDGGDPEWGYFVVPYLLNGNLDGAINISNGTMSVSFKGQGQKANDSWGVNPYGDNPLMAVAGFPVGKIWAIVRTTVQPPEVTVGCVALS